MVALLLFLSGCGAFVAPGVLGPGTASLAAKRILSVSAMERTTPSMVTTGLPSKNPRRKRPWEDDFATTLGKAAFTSLKDKARDMMVKGAEKRGLDWTGIVETLQVLILC